MSNLIQQLKDNEKPFGLMSEEMQEKAKGIGQPEFEMYMKNDTWMVCGSYNNFTLKKVTDQTYRLRSGYEDEPEIEECEIIGTRYSIKHLNGTGTITSLSEAINDPRFIGFKFESGQVELSPIVFKSDCSTKSICQFRDLAALTVLHATHVLFRRKKQK